MNQTMQAAAELVFGTCDLREFILSIRRLQMIKDLTKRIYPKWKHNALTDEYYVNGSPGPFSEDGTYLVTWSLMRMNIGQVDTGRLLITDFVSRKNEKRTIKFDGLFNAETVEIRNQDWYIPREELHRMSQQRRYREIDEYYDIVSDFLYEEKEKRMILMDKEMIRRNERAEYVVYKIPQY